MADYEGLGRGRGKPKGHPAWNAGTGGSAKVRQDVATRDRSSGCWTDVEWWTDEWGYGVFRVGGVKRRAHAFAKELATGEASEGRFACHSCDVPSCFNPDHIFWGTQLDNMRDCARKGRTTLGDKNARGRAKVTADQVREIRRRREGGETCKALADEFGLSPVAVSKMVRRVTWEMVA